VLIYRERAWYFGESACLLVVTSCFGFASTGHVEHIDESLGILVMVGNVRVSL